MIKNVVNIYELNLGFFYSPKKRSRSYDWKGLDQNKGLGIMTRNFLYTMTINGYNIYFMTIIDILIIIRPIQYRLENPTRILTA